MAARWHERVICKMCSVKANDPDLKIRERCLDNRVPRPSSYLAFILWELYTYTYLHCR